MNPISREEWATAIQVRRLLCHYCITGFTAALVTAPIGHGRLSYQLVSMG